MDIGEAKSRTITAGAQQYCSVEQMMEGFVVVFANLKPKTMSGTMSKGQILFVTSEDMTDVSLLRPSEKAKIGERIVVEGMEMPQDFQDELKPKEKRDEKVMAQMFTNHKGEAAYGQGVLMTSAGPIVSEKCQFKIQ